MALRVRGRVPSAARPRRPSFCARSCGAVARGGSGGGGGGGGASRREAVVLGLGGGGGVVLGAASPHAAHAAMAVEGFDAELGGTAYEFAVPLRVAALRGSVPTRWGKEFTRAQGSYARLSLRQKATMDAIWKELVDGKDDGGKSAAVADAVTLGDAWLAPAVAKGLVQPIPKHLAASALGRVPARWQPTFRRAADGRPDPSGQVYGVPYRWGCTVVAYREDRLKNKGGPVADWGDLLRPELKGRVAMVASSREFVGAACKSLGLGYNEPDLAAGRCGVTWEDVRERVRALRRQVRLFDSTSHLKALAAGDVYACVGWSDDVLPFISRIPTTAAAVPASGTALFADLWAVPKRAGDVKGSDGSPSPLLPAWWEFCLMPARADSAGGLKRGAPPSAPRAAGAAPPSPLDGLPPEAVLARSEFLAPLTPRAREQYAELARLAA